MSKKILIIDDDKQILFAMSAICQYQHWVPITATSVKEGIGKYKKENPDIVLIDYHLPVVNGIEGVKMLRKLDEDVPIIVLTVEEDQEVADRFIEVGASDFALKPIKAPDIISRINVHIRFKKSMEEVIKGMEDYTKGISHETLEIIQNYMSIADSYYSINNIAKATGLAYQTVHRYLQYMESEEIVEVSYKYGKIGRPQKRYKLKKNEI